MIADGINAPDIPKDVLRQVAGGIQNLDFDGEGVDTMVVKDICRFPQGSPNHLVQNKLDEQMPLDNQPKLICMIAKPGDVMKHDVLI
jgi:hypothetical protein